MLYPVEFVPCEKRIIRGKSQPNEKLRMWDHLCHRETNPVESVREIRHAE